MKFNQLTESKERETLVTPAKKRAELSAFFATYLPKDFRSFLPAALIGLLAFVSIFVAYQVPASFYLDANNNRYFSNFYPAEQTDAAATTYRWGTSGAKVLFPPLASSSQLTLRLSVVPRPGQPEETPLVILIDHKEAARFSLKPGWQEYSFKLDRKLSGTGNLEVELDAPTFQVKGDRRLFTVAFNWLKVEANPAIPPLGGLIAFWLTIMAFYLALALQRTRLAKLPKFWPEIGGVLAIIAMAGLIAGQRDWLGWNWLVLLLAAVTLAGLSWTLQPFAAPDKSRAGRWLILILLLAAFVRLYNLNLAPLDTLPDEAVMGYDAYSILKTGHDHHGDFLPLYFRSYNDYVPGVSIYFTIPTIALFGLNVWAIRLPFALLGVVAVLFSYLLARELFYNAGQKARELIGLLAALFVTVSPWAVSQSRIALPFSPLSFLFLGGFWLILRARRRVIEEKKATWDWLIAGLMLGLAAWTYSTMKLIIVLFAGGVLLIYGPFFWRKRVAFLAWAGIFTAVCLPFSLVMLAGWSRINYRFSQISVWANNDFLGGLGQFTQNYFAHYDPLRLFFKLDGDYVVTMSSRPALTGVVLPALALPAILGLISTFRREWRVQPSIWLLWLWFVIFPLASALTNQDVPNEIRTIDGTGLFEILAAFGVWWLWERLKSVKLSFGRARVPYLAAALFGLVFIIAAGAYLHFTLVADPVHPRAYFRPGFAEALAEAEKRVQPGGKICVENSSQAYMLVLFSKRYDPATYQEFARRNDPPTNTGYLIKSFDKYEFNCDSPQDLRPGDVGLTRNLKGGLQPLWQTFYPDGEVAWWVVQ